MSSDLSPDDKRLFILLCRLGLKPPDALIFVQELNSTASASLIDRLENRLDSKLDGQSASLDANLDRLHANLDALLWLAGFGFAGTGILIAVLRLLG